MKGPLSATQSKYYIWLSPLSHIHTSKSMSGKPLGSQQFSVFCTNNRRNFWPPRTYILHVITYLCWITYHCFHSLLNFILCCVVFFFKEVTAELRRNKPRQTSVWHWRHTPLWRRQEAEKLAWYSLIKKPSPEALHICLPTSAPTSTHCSDPDLLRLREKRAEDSLFFVSSRSYLQ